MISVIIQVYNRAHVIKRAIESVLSQTFKDFELISVNDCSTDNSIEIIEGFKDERIRCFQTSKNMGAAAARNLGIKNSRGSIISFLDSDDYYEPEILKISYDLLSKSRNETGFMWTGCRNYVNNKNFEFCWEPLYNESFYITFLTSLHIGTNSGISVKKSVFEKCGYFSETLPAAEDTDFFLRITQHYGYVFSKKILINIDKKGQDRLSKDFKNCHCL